MSPSASSSAIPNLLSQSEEPIRAELLSLERLEQHAGQLAATHTQTIAPESRKGRPLTPRVLENSRILLECYRSLAKAVQQEYAITPAAEWLVDNFHIVDEQVREVRDHLPAGFYRKLPKLASGDFEGFPRVFALAWAFVAHTDSRLDPEVLRRFIDAYQSIQPLTIGELWAVTITLRIVLVENLRRIAQTIVRGRAARQEADALADRLIGAGGQPPVPPEQALTSVDSSPLAEAFAVQLLQRLRDLSPNVRPVLLWLDQRLAEQGTTADEVVRAEHRQQAAMNVTVRNIITTMRLISALDWHDFFEEVSLVDRTLRQDTNFSQLTFATRDAYRHAVEDLSRHSAHSETDVAQRVIDRVKSARQDAPGGPETDEVLADPGFYLVSRGRLQFERELGYQPPFARRLLRLYIRHGSLAYLGTIALLTAAILLLYPLLRDVAEGVSAGYLVLLGILALVPASDLAISLINRLVTDLLQPRSLPRLELKKGVPEAFRTIVVTPTLLTKISDVHEMIGHLEVHFLANQDGCLHYALLSDWLDAPQESLPSDGPLLAEAINGIARLNRLYGPAPGGGLRFLLFHRKRVWNPSEGKWMGWERKRGKLHEMNRFLRGSNESTFLPLDPSVFERLEGVRYVLTLDSDTRLPRGAAQQLIGTIAHPLNRAIFSEQAGRIVEGYGVVQPRVTPSLPTENQGTLFQRIFSGPSGIDPYPSAISDVYQDLFHEGSYTGKGLYDIDAFEKALAGKVPNNALLSHDLFEGTLARTALVTDAEFFEEYPAQYAVSAARQHRWARGDWQLLPWVFANGPKGYRTNVPIVGRWKMFDNLRRSLSAPAAFLTLLAGWLIPGASPGVWTRYILAIIAIPALLPFFMGLNPRSGISKRSYLRGLLSDLATGASQIALTVTFLAYQAWLMGDAIVRTLVRLVITRKRLLEWITAAQAKHMVDLRISTIYTRMAGGVVLAGLAALALAIVNPRAFALGGPFVALWLAAPAVARWVSMPPAAPKTEIISIEQRESLRLIARRTWRFFETFVSDEDHFLPPDNFQEDPKPTVAHRTSPTNMGLSLLATLAAHDFGWLGIAETIDRVEKAFHTMDGLEKFRGHFYNWYDTRSLQPLEPRYISSVDSGNLAGHLLAIANGLRDLEKSPVARNLDVGLQDNLEVLRAAIANISEARPTHIVTRKQILSAAEDLAGILRRQPHDLPDFAERIAVLRSRARALADIVQTFLRERGDAPDSELQRCADAILHCVESHSHDAEILIPLSAPEENSRPPANSAGSSQRAPRLQIVKQASSYHLAALRGDFPCLANSAHLFDQALQELHASGSDLPSPEDSPEELSAVLQVQRGAENAAALAGRLSALIQAAENMLRNMDFTFLFDRSRKLFSIGYRPKEGILDLSCYDLLASEARLTSFVAIAKGDVEPSHWFKLGRSFTPVGRGSALISWSGSMFEYLMPTLVMHSPAGSVLHLTNELVVRRQIEYGAQRHVPWGISESAFNARDLDLTYQYSGFGIPGLGLKRGLSEDLVIAPYATALASMVAPSAAAQNFQALAQKGGMGTYGFYESLDFTKTRIPEGHDVAVVHTYMAHHQGMSLLSLANVLLDDIVQNRFHAEPIIQATDLLLQERTPRDVLVAHPRAEEVKAAAHVREVFPAIERRFTTPHEPLPRTQLLSNGKYALMLTSAGSGYSHWGDLAVTRWREDATRDAWGSYIFLRDVHSNEVWPAGYQPCLVEPDSYEVCFYEDRAEFTRRDRSIVTALEVVVSSEDDAEMRRVSITNYGAHERTIQVTSYAEICLAPQAADLAHPAFSNLFVETDFDRRLGALLATRRRQSDQQEPVWLAHVAVVDSHEVGEVQFETDRAKFVGRGRSVRAPACVADGAVLSNTVGAVLDPIISLRRTVRIPPNKTVRIIFSTALAPSRDRVLALADKYRDPNIFERILTLAWTQAQVQLHHLSIQPDEANLFQRLANSVLYSDASLRPAPAVLSRAFIDVRQLWGHGISGDLPIVLALVDQVEDVDIVRQLLRAHEYWRLKQLAVDLVIINEEPSSYEQELHGSLASMVRDSQLRHPDANNRRGDVFLLRADLVQPQTRRILESMARAVLVGRRGSLADQLTRASLRPEKPIRLKIARSPRALEPALPEAAQTSNLEFFNGLGGFSENGREYVIVLGEGLRTPQPWINVIANPSFGFLASESGSGYTWSLNSRERQLTPWSNDPVTDPPGEAIYIRDEADGDLWTPTALPIRDDSTTYIAHHGQGYSRFEHVSRSIRCNLLQYVPLTDPIKISRLTLRNDSPRSRRLSITAYAEWVLGNLRSATAPHLITEIDTETGGLFARSAHAGEFAGRVAFADLAGLQQSCSADRKEFLGRHRSVDSPAALDRGAPLSGKVGAALDPCAALQTCVELRPGAEIEVSFFLGDAPNEAEARRLIAKYRAANLDEVLDEVVSYWDNLLGGVQVSTPDRSMDLLLNRWLLYQTLSCRIWGRAAFYQLSGAYGFRDQLQDIMALCVPKRDVTREHLLRAAGRQFPQADVQHWWHPPSGRGTRTHISDDRLWLPYAVSHFIERTTDMSVLDERVPFLEGDPIPEGQADSYFEPRVSETTAALFEHCARAIDSSLAVGAHGLPLMGTGDWNDGMNRVGEHGKGESVWLGWFLHEVLRRFIRIAADRGEHDRAQKWRLHAGALQAALEREAWDGEWYLRAFYDDGFPLGSSRNAECRIDSITQSWAVISRAAEPGRARQAMASVYGNLVLPRDGLVLLFTPPFAETPPHANAAPPPVATTASEKSDDEPAELAHTAAAAGGTTVAAQIAAGSRSSEREPQPAPAKNPGTNGRHSSDRMSNGPAAIDPPVEAQQVAAGSAVAANSAENSAPLRNLAPHDPGYIKGYLPGIRENGGQYTHASIWNVLAFTMLGDGDRAAELFRMLNPINHSSSRAAVQCYKVEPYVLAGDVYSQPPHVGRGGWTWYTGSSGWLYRVGIECILGFQLHGLSVRIDPCIPRDWPRFSITFRYHSAVYDIRVENPSAVSKGVALTRIDGTLHAGIADIRLADDHRHHDVLVVLG